VWSLARGIDSDATIIVDKPDAAFRLEEGVFRPLGAIGVLDKHVGRCEHRRCIARAIHLAHHDVVFTRHDLIGVRLHGFERIKNARQLLVLDLDRSQCSIGGSRVDSSDRRNGISLETYLVDHQ
jgi:hypothetical protein